MAYVASFLAQAHRQDRLMEHQQQAIAMQVEAKRGEVLKVWQEGRTISQLADQIRDMALKAREKDELQASDERSIMSYGRGRGGSRMAATG